MCTTREMLPNATQISVELARLDVAEILEDEISEFESKRLADFHGLGGSLLHNYPSDC